MRALVLCVGLAACAPDIHSGSYLCGPNASCPDGQACNGAADEDSGLMADTCVLASTAQPFACVDKNNAEPNNTAAEGLVLENLQCLTAAVFIESCMTSDDNADWLTFVAPPTCAAVEVQARLVFSIAFEMLGLELWDLDRDVQLATEGECAQGAAIGAVRRCLDFELVPGTRYGVKVRPTGEGNCDGACAYNRYSLSVQLATPG